MKILVLHSWGIGDLIMATPMLKSLYKNGHVVDLVLTSKINKSIVKNSDFIENIFFIKNKLDFLRFYKKYDCFIVTAGTNPKKAMLLNFLVGAKKIFSVYQEKDIHRIQMNLEMVEPLLDSKVYKPYVYINDNQDILKNYIVTDRKNIGFAVGSGVKQKFKRWGIEKYIKLFGKFDANILVFIGPEEVELKEKLSIVPNIKLVIENLEDTITIISNLSFLIGNDNGLMHIGHSLEIKTFTIFGMTADKETGGYDKRKNHDIYLDIDCRPCFHTTYKSITCTNHLCFDDLTVEYVYGSIKGFLND